MKMIGGESPTVSRLYRISGVDWLLAEQKQFSSTTTLRHADLNGLPQDITITSTTPHNNVWLYLSPRLCTLGEDAFEHAPAVIKEMQDVSVEIDAGRKHDVAGQVPS